MKRWAPLLALAAVPLLGGTALADAPDSAPTVSPKRQLPDYDGRGPPPSEPTEQLLWVPRVILGPLYLTSEFVLRRPLSVIVPAAESIDLPNKVYNFFTFGPEHKAGLVPIGFVEFDFSPSVGVYAFWDDAGFKGDELRLHAEVWTDDWLGGSLTQRIRFDETRMLQLRLTGLRRPDRVFYGIGPDSLQAYQSRYGMQRVDASVGYQSRFWRSSQIQTTVGVRDVTVYDGSFGVDPGLKEEAATGAYPLPYGFGGEYTDVYNRVVAAVDSRVPGRQRRPGVRLELAGEQGSDVRSTPSAGWLRYGATAAGYVDLTGHGRILGLSVMTQFADPLGATPVPFTELVYLGGDHPMRGFYQGRLLGRSAAVATLSYTWPIGPWLDGDLQLEVGNAFGEHLEGFDPRLLRFSGALGISIAGLQDAPVEFLLGVGSETFEHGGQVDAVRVMFGVPHTF